jgi:hypothetical protein
MKTQHTETRVCLGGVKLDKEEIVEGEETKLFCVISWLGRGFSTRVDSALFVWTSISFFFSTEGV